MRNRFLFQNSLFAVHEEVQKLGRASPYPLAFILSIDVVFNCISTL